MPTLYPHPHLMVTIPTTFLLVDTACRCVPCNTDGMFCLTPATLRSCPQRSSREETTVPLLATTNGDSFCKKLFHPYLTCHPTLLLLRLPSPVFSNSHRPPVTGGNFNEAAAVKNTKDKNAEEDRRNRDRGHKKKTKICSNLDNWNKALFSSDEPKTFVTLLILKFGLVHLHPQQMQPLSASFVQFSHCENGTQTLRFTDVEFFQHTNLNRCRSESRPLEPRTLL